MIAVLWDLDGTIVDSAADIAAAVDRMLEGHGMTPLGEARVRAFIGEGARRLVDRCVEAAGGAPTDAHLAAFLAAYRDALAVHTRVDPPALLDLLPRVAAPMAIVTNKPEAMSVALLDTLGLRRFFPVVIGGDTLPVRKPEPLPVWEALSRLRARHGVLVGDGPADVGAGLAAGVPVVGVDWGIAAPEGATVRVGDVPALEAALRGLGVPFRD